MGFLHGKEGAGIDCYGARRRASHERESAEGVSY